MSKCKAGETVREHYEHGGTLGDVLPGEDLVTPEHLLHAPTAGGIAADLARGAVDTFIADLELPEFRVRLGVSCVAAVVCGHAGIRFLPALLISAAAGSAAVWLYESAEEIKTALGGGNAAGEV